MQMFKTLMRSSAIGYPASLARLATLFGLLIVLGGCDRRGEAPPVVPPTTNAAVQQSQG